MSGTTSNDLYSRLQADTGINFLMLREKYKNVSSSCTPSTTSPTNNESTHDIHKNTNIGNDLNQNYTLSAGQEAMRKLDGYKICKNCNGQGLVKEIYNHFVTEKNCSECDGDGIFNIQESVIRSP
jgi:DnaJ-class molecular chaperone